MDYIGVWTMISAAITIMVSTFACTLVAATAEEESLWDRMGGLDKITPLVSDVYDRHASDPLSRDWFGPDKFTNNGNPDFVKRHILEFLSAGIGGPLEYTGRSMLEAHKGMDIPLDAFHAIIFHMVEGMEAHQTGTPEDRHTISAILRSLEADVRGDRFAREQAEAEEESFNEEL